MDEREDNGARRIAADIVRASGAPEEVVFVSGNFNILHPGHIRFLRFAKSCGKFLAVGVQSDRLAGASVYVAGPHRLEAVNALSVVDYAFLLDVPPEDFIGALRPAVVVKGKEHETRANAEADAVGRYGGRLLFSSGEVVYSSLELLSREFSPPSVSAPASNTDYMRRHDIAEADLRAMVKAFSGLKAVVIGDAIVDEYIACEAVGMSREEPVIVLAPLQRNRFAGGASIVAGHMASLGADVTYFTVCGQDAEADFTATRVADYGVGQAHIIRDASRPTTLKQRFRADDRSLFRLNTFRQHEISVDIQNDIRRRLWPLLPDASLLVFSDFNYGMLPQPLVDDLIAACSKHGVLTVADSQSSSQSGDVSRYRGVGLLTPTEYEMRTALHDFRSGIVVAAEALGRKTNASNVLVKLGKDGLLVHARTADGWMDDRIPALNGDPRDVSGAGDSLLAAASLAMAAGTDVWRSALIGSLAAACQISRLGNTPLTPEDLLRSTRY